MPENELDLSTLCRDVASVRERFAAASARGARSKTCIVIKNERAGGDVFSVDFLANLFESEARGQFDARRSVLGHLQQGGLPTVLDRLNAWRLAQCAVDAIERALRDAKATSVMVGIERGLCVTTPVAEFESLVDLKHRRPREQWWCGDLMRGFDLMRER